MTETRFDDITMNINFNIVLGQRATWPELLARARETEVLGFDGLFLVDHFYGLRDVTDPTHEAYTMLAALAPFTQRVRLGILVCGNTYRNPAFLLKQAVTVDHVSGGRVDFGVGAGWVEREHEAYGFPFPSARERVDRFAEALDIWDLLQREERTTYEGAYYQLLDAPFAPKPLQQPRLPLLIGGSGPRMLRLTARHADTWNVVGAPEEVAAVNQRLDAACLAEGRDPASLVRTVSPRINLLASAEAFADGVAAYRAAGFRDIFLPWPRTEAELPVLRQVAREVIPGLRAQSPRPRPASAQTPSLADLDSVTEEEVRRAYAAVRAGPPRQLLELLIDHPGERFDGASLLTRLGLQRHDEVTRGIAALAADLASHGLARPWNESQLGYELSTAHATRLARARDRGGTT
ncbi:MAG: TIGR03560 family F420-dependent LLM class oxidoreductase [Chloroflexota bacterium]|nr:TIGR03560 family F420-dependent LLM class oxidoreductase [Chloroflexota bacterium]